MDNPVSSIRIQLGKVTNVSQVEELGHTLIAQNVMLNGKERNVIVIMDTGEYKRLEAQGGRALVNKIQEIVNVDLFCLKTALELKIAKDPRLHVLNVEQFTGTEIDQEINNIQEIINGIQSEKKSIDDNEIQIIEHMKKIPGITTEELNALKKQTQNSHRLIDEKISKLEEQRESLLAYQKELKGELRQLTKTANVIDVIKPKVFQPKTKPAPPKYGVEKLFELYKSNPKNVESLKVEFNKLPKANREESLIKLYQDTLKNVKGNQESKGYQSFDNFCHAMQQEMVTIALSNNKTYTIPKILCDKEEYVKVKVEGKFINFGVDAKGNKIIKFEEVPTELQPTFVKALMYRSAEGIITPHNIQDLLITSHELHVNWLTVACEKYLMDNLDKENVGDISILANTLQLPDVLRACLIYSYNNRQSISPKIMGQIQKLTQTLGKTEWDILAFLSDKARVLPDGRLNVEVTRDNFEIYEPFIMKLGIKNESWYQPALQLSVKNDDILSQKIRDRSIAITNQNITLKVQYDKVFPDNILSNDDLLDWVVANPCTHLSTRVAVKNEGELKKLLEILNKPELEMINVKYDSFEPSLLIGFIKAAAKNTHLKAFILQFSEHADYSAKGPSRKEMKEAINLLLENKSLEFVVLKNNFASTNLLLEAPYIKSLCLSLLTKDNLLTLTEHKTLTYLDIKSFYSLESERYTPEVYKMIANNRSLETLILDASKVDFQQLAEAVNRNPTLKLVYLTNTNMYSFERMVELYLVLDANKSLKSRICFGVLSEANPEFFGKAYETIMEQSFQTGVDEFGGRGHMYL